MKPANKKYLHLSKFQASLCFCLGFLLTKKGEGVLLDVALGVPVNRGGGGITGCWS